MSEPTTLQYLEDMRDYGGLALFWEGGSTMSGWNLFDDEAHVFEWLHWLVTEGQGVALDEKEAASFQQRLASVEDVLKTEVADRAARFLDEANRFIRIFDEEVGDSQDRHRFCDFTGLNSDAVLLEAFREHQAEREARPSLPHEDLREFAEMLRVRYPGPGYWTHPGA